MANVTGQPTAATPTVVTASTTDPSHQAALLLLGQVVGVVVLAWIAGFDDRIGTVIVAFFVVLWIIWLMNRSDVIQQWGAKVGL